MINKDSDFMHAALDLAKQAGEMGEVPVGAVVVRDNIIIGRGYNRPITTSDPTSHAEIIALREAALYLCNYRLLNCTMYVTLEPCIMCIGAIFHARIARLIYGTKDPKTGACGSVIDLVAQKQLNHHTQVTGTLLEDESSSLLKNFFINKRKTN
tara:strand:- start:7035 stop:7496 length:462 start_codon:yes stop_codon:yes gene_type:complete